MTRRLKVATVTAEGMVTAAGGVSTRGPRGRAPIMCPLVGKAVRGVLRNDEYLSWPTETAEGKSANGDGYRVVTE